MTVERDPGARFHVVRFAPAKLNLTLAVTGRRSDGYHDLHSIMAPLSLGDALTVAAAPPGAAGDSLRMSGLAIPAGPHNLVLRAISATRAAVLAQRTGGARRTFPLAARLSKRVPVSAGLGGGSSDAAAAIDAALAAWRVELGADSVAALAAGLGSDVPFFLARGAALVTGRGELVEPLPDVVGELPAVLLVTPQLPLATPAVFEAYDGGARGADAALARDTSERLAAEMRAGMSSQLLLARAEALASANDLTAAAASLAPGLAAFVDALERLLGRPVCQSGSGPTLWSLYPSLADARKAGRFVRLATLNGTLPLVGGGAPFIGATTISGRTPPHAAQPAAGTPITIRPRTVHNGLGTDETTRGETAEDPDEEKGDHSR